MYTDSTIFGDWINTTGDSLKGLWGTVVSFLPALIGAIVVFIIGLIVASLLEKIVERVIYHLKIDSVLRKAELEGYLERANIKLNSGKFLGKLVYWFVVIGFLVAAADILHFTAFSKFFEQIIAFTPNSPNIPNVIIAALIMLFAMVVANFLRHLVSASVASAKLNHSRGLGAMAWWVVVVFGFLTALTQIGVDTGIINALVTGFIAMLALAGGLAFGLGGRDRAASFLNHWSEEMKH